MGKPEKVPKGKSTSEKGHQAEKAETDSKSKYSKKKFNFTGGKNGKGGETSLRKSRRKIDKVPEVAEGLEKTPSEVAHSISEEKESASKTSVNESEREVAANSQTGKKDEVSENEEVLDYDEEPVEMSNESNSAQKDSGEENEERDYSSGSTVREKEGTSFNSSESDSSKIVSLKNTPKKRRKRGEKRRRRELSPNDSDSSSSRSTESSSNEEHKPKKRIRKSLKRQEKRKRKRKAISKPKKHKKRKRRRRAESTSSDSSESSENIEEEKEIRGLTEKTLKKLFAEYYNDRKAKEKEDLMKAIPDTAGQLQLNKNFRSLSINLKNSETTIYSKSIPSKDSSPREEMSQEIGTLLANNSRKNSSEAELITQVFNDTKNRSSSDDAFDISPVGQRTLPKPPTVISDDLALAEAMNRPEWSQAIERAREEADRILREAEANKVRMVKPSGERIQSIPLQTNRTTKKGVVDVIDSIERHKDTDKCDEIERLMSSHVDESVKLKIQKGEFIELHKLIFKDKTSENEGNKVKVTNPDGDTYFIPSAGEDNSCVIGSFRKWQKCFRVYAEIYATANPSRAGDIIQYMDDIENAASLYIWENVAKYDLRFRRLMAKYPHRKWSDRYKKAYEDSMTDPLAVRTLMNLLKKQSTFSGSKKPTNACWRFNKHGKCDLGASCSMDHKCSFCGKFGHYRQICHKLKNTSNEQGNNKSNSKHKDRN